MPNNVPPRFCLLVPVKPPARAKSRLAPLGEQVRRSLVTAFVTDTVTAALASRDVGAVLVVTDDHVLAGDVRDLGADVVPDGVTDDLNGSLVQAAAEARRRWPDLVPAAICADLPSLVAQDLTAALEVAARHRVSFVADADGRGTTLFAATSPEAFEPRFGAGSREAHLADGAHEIREVVVPSLRRDVDTPEDLAAAARLGLRGRTAEVVAGLRLAAMQATVSSFDPETFDGAVLLDDGVELPFSGDALTGSGIRLLRPGQRVRLETSGDGADVRVERLQIITLS